MADEVFIQRPTEVYRAYLTAYEAEVGWAEGRMAMALEVITVRKSLQAVGMLTPGMTSTLDSLLADQGLLDEADALYDELNEWRKTKIRDASSDAPHPSSDESRSRSRAHGPGRLTSPFQDRKKDPSP